jgi:hypothetical protein
MKFVIAVFLIVVLATPVSAAELSDNQKGVISQNCNSIKTSLKSLQKSDSRVRVLLGTRYQTILTNFLTPLNLRLVKDNRPSSTLSTIQTDMATERNVFQEQFIKYSQQLEELISLDCQKSPEDFYAKLKSTRTQREMLNRSAVRLKSLIYKHIIAVTEFKKGEQ